MLLEFRLDNFKSYWFPQVFSMRPEFGGKALESSIIKLSREGEDRGLEALCSSVICGSNGSGKSNLLIALSNFRDLILAGNMNFDRSRSLTDYIYSPLKWAPRASETDVKPIVLGIAFVANDLKIDYEIHIEVGKYLESDYQRKVVYEKLQVNDEAAFERKEHQITINQNSFTVKNSSSSQECSLLEINEKSNRSLKQDEPFLCHGFNTIVNPDLAAVIINWFKNDLKIMAGPRTWISLRWFDISFKAPLLEVFQCAADSIRPSFTDFTFIPEEGENEFRCLLNRIYKQDGSRLTVQTDIYESQGTYEFTEFFTHILEALVTGSTLLVDDLDGHLDPRIVLSLLDLFHNKDLNKFGAQFIFTTRNPLFFDDEHVRPDEMKISVSFQAETTFIYSISALLNNKDFKGSKDNNYVKNYLRGEYTGRKILLEEMTLKLLKEEEKER